MNYNYLTEFFASYSLPTIIIAIIVAVVSLLVNGFLKDKLNAIIRTYLPFAFAIILYFAFDMIFVFKAFIFKEQTLYAGILAGSLSMVITSIINRIRKGKPLTVSQTILIIEGILNGYIPEQNLSSTAKALESEIEKSQTPCVDTLAQIIKNNSSTQLDNDEYLLIARLILTAVMENNKDKKSN